MVSFYILQVGDEMKQFCAQSCLREFKDRLKVCSFCDKNITGKSDAFSAPVGNMGNFRVTTTFDICEFWSALIYLS